MVTLTPKATALKFNVGFSKSHNPPKTNPPNKSAEAFKPDPPPLEMNVPILGFSIPCFPMFVKNPVK